MAFDGPFGREHADAWASEFVDVESLNRTASDAVIERIHEVQRGARGGQLRSSSILIVGPAGAGKTHLFMRWRRAIGPRAAFVLLRPQIGVEPTPRHVLAAVLDALARTSFGSAHRQIDCVVGSALADAVGVKPTFPAAVVDHCREMTAEEREDAIARTLDQLEQQHEGIDIPWIDRLLRTPFASNVDRRAAMTWLSGREADEAQLARLGKKSQLDQTLIVPALRSLAVIAAHGAPVVLVFDQLENLLGDESERNVRAHGQLVSELFDAVPGLVMVQMALDTEWDQRIRPLFSSSQATRVEATRLTLELPRASEREQLIRRWLERVEPGERGGPYPAPFGQAQIDAWLSRPAQTPRQLMIACREALQRQGAPDESLLPQGLEPVPVAPPDPGALDDRLAVLHHERLAAARHELDELGREHRGIDRSRLRAALLVGLRAADVEVTAAPSKAHHDLVVKVADGPVLIYLAQHAHWRSLGAALDRALAEPRVRVIRERSVPVPPTWRTVREQLASLDERRPGVFVELDRGELLQLLALHDLLAAARSQDLADAQGSPIEEAAVQTWVKETLGPREWRIVQLASGAAGVPGEAASPAPASPAASAPAPASPTRAAPARAPAKSAPAAAPSGPAWEALSRLRIASIEYLLREVRKTKASTRRPELLRELDDLGPRVRWFGRNLVALDHLAHDPA